MNAQTTQVSKEEFLRRLASEHQLFDAILAALTPRQRTVAGVYGEWSVKDILAHLIAHDQQALDDLRDARRGEHFGLSRAANDHFNAEAVRAAQARSWEEVHTSWDASFREVVAAIETLPEGEFAAGGRVAKALGDTVSGALGPNTYGHYAEHRAQIERWLHGDM